jgi:solute carrier family 25 2-oxodicarboxylate transporter 21
MAKEIKEKSAWVLSIAGALSGVAEALCVQPLDMIKTRFQLNPEKNPSIIQALKHVLHEGGFLRFYRGILPEIVGMIPRSTAMYMGNELARRWLTEKNNGVCNYYIAATAGWIAGIPEACAVTPFQVVKVRLQSKSHLGHYTNSWDCVQKIVTQEGPLRLFNGLTTTCWRNSVWNSVYFGSMWEMKGFLPQSDHHLVSLATTLVSGFIGGVIATTVNCPLDVAKSRIQSQRHEVGVVLKYQSTFPSLYTIFKEEGAVAIYKGYTPKVLRMGVGGAIAMAAFEATCIVVPNF